MLKITLVSFPIDYGNVTLQSNLVRLLGERCDLVHHVFSASEAPGLGARLNAPRRVWRRLGEMARLRRVCAEARREGRILLFQQISPALFAWPFRRGVPSYILSDWTRKLYEPLLGERLSSAPVTWLHARVLRSVDGVLAFTAAAADSLRRDYGVPEPRLHRLAMPFDVQATPVAPAERPGPLRVLFVGGDFERKGGPALLRWYARQRPGALRLTVLTQSAVQLPEGVTLLRNDPTKGARDLFFEHDLFVLPTLCDGYPQALGEAASAGLALVTTDKALGAPEIIDEGRNGHVVRSEAELAARLAELMRDPARLAAYKAHSRAKMLAQFAFEPVFAQLAAILHPPAHGLPPVAARSSPTGQVT